MNFEPTKKSLKKHEVPDWFHDAKFGIFIHWGVYSVPAFAVSGRDIVESIKEEGFEGYFNNNTYAEWYINTLRIKGSSAYEYHRKTYGEDFSYEDFIPQFNEEIKKWDPDEMTDIFKKAGAKYVVLVTKHHDGFLLWPSKYPHPHKKDYCASRNIVGELTDEVKKKGMKMGYYYSSTLDFSFNPGFITDAISMISAGVMTPEYTKYVNSHWYELIDDYDPIILWNDIGYPPDANTLEIFAYFYNKHPDGVINDRWSQLSKRLISFLTFGPIGKILNWASRRVMIRRGAGAAPLNKHSDFSTPEYTQFKEIKETKWECTRGIGYSFGYNQFETESDYLALDELLIMFVDIVSKNGNLLLNVGPKADGSIPEIQKKLLLKLGEWLEVNGDAIFGTRPWVRAEGKTLDELDLRFTQKGDILYVFILQKPKRNKIVIQSLEINENSQIQVVGQKTNLDWMQIEKNLLIEIPEKLQDDNVNVLKIENYKIEKIVKPKHNFINLIFGGMMLFSLIFLIYLTQFLSYEIFDIWTNWLMWIIWILMASTIFHYFLEFFKNISKKRKGEAK